MNRLLFVVPYLALAALPMSLDARDRFQQPAPVHVDKQGEKWARQSLKKMTLEQKIGQMFILRARAQFLNLDSPEYLTLRDTMRR